MYFTLFKITSFDNKVYKHIKKLETSKYRSDIKQFCIEGLKIVNEAIDYKQDIVHIVMDENYYNKIPESFLCKIEKRFWDKSVVFDNKLFKKIAKTDTPQGIMAVLNEKQHDSITFSSEKKFFLVLDGIQDPGNMGTIIRTAHGAGVDFVIASKGCVDIYNPKVIRSTMGSIFHVPVIKNFDIIDLVKELKNDGVKIFSASLDTNNNFFDYSFKEGVAIVIGNEANGVSKEVQDVSDHLIKIPMAKKLESLNASVAAGIVMYEIMKQRMIM